MKTMESDFEQEKTSLLNRKEAEINELKQQLETNADNLSKQEIQTQAHKQFLDKITLEKEAIQVGNKKMLSKKIFLYCEISSNNAWCLRVGCEVLIHDGEAGVN